MPTANGYQAPPEAGSVKDLKGSVPAPKQPVSTDEMNEAIFAGAAASAGHRPA